MGGGEHRSLNQQASGFTPILGFRKSEILKKKFKAFTLAEVLITLAIIGVVAALTIPTVVAKYQKKQYYTQFMKMYNTLSTALSMAETEHGDYDSWGITSDNQEELFNNNILSYLKVSKKITPSDTEYDCDDAKLLNGSSSPDPYWNQNSDEYPTYVLSDGTIIQFVIMSDWLSIYFDTNGLKGPNVVGRDIFQIDYVKLDDKWALTTLWEYKNSKMAPLSNQEAYEMIFGDSDGQNCTTDKNSEGYGCAGRLLLEGKMNY